MNMNLRNSLRQIKEEKVGIITYYEKVRRGYQSLFRHGNERLALNGEKRAWGEAGWE
jgi:hypothetical protein